MPNKMLIDATHPEETRVVVVSGNRVDEFDFESESRKQLRGNIYLAKITRVEPSLQAAFVEYGGNRHGFLAFSEIHPDYYQIPVADREALVRQQAAEARREAEEEDRAGERAGRAQAASASSNVEEIETSAEDDQPEEIRPHGDHDDDHHDDEHHDDEHHEVEAHDDETHHEDENAAHDDEHNHDHEAAADDSDATVELVEASEDESAPSEEAKESGETESDSEARDETDSVHSDETVEALGSEDPHEEVQEEAAPRKQRHNYRNYKIQEVVKRRQIMLVQVVKEERGNKGAALTTFLSLAGRYCVLMPNTARGGGISRKITQAADRKKLKAIAESLEVPEGMGLIIRTAGAKRTKVEIKRDYEYLLRMWESVRELTLRSTAPALVYEEGSLIKRSIRDLYDKDIDTVFVDGDEGYKEAKNFMRMLMPSHAKNVQLYKDRVPLFQKHQIEQQLDAMFQPVVTLKSGGYIVINPTEALVSIDVNSGRSTKERNIEQTALRTNLEAAEEIARQMRLRDLAGLIVIDFIDMDENRNNRSVERKLKDALRNDRARIQVGRISHFGLLEMSRQRMRSGVLEGSTVICQHCSGTGLIRSVESLTLHVLRSIEAEAAKGRGAAFTAKVPVEVAIYILNQKRANLLDIEDRYGTSVYIEADATLKASDHRIELAEARALTRTRPAQGAINIESTYNAEAAYEEPGDDSEEEVEEDEEETEAQVSSESESPRQERARPSSDEDEGARRGKRRRRRRRGGRPNEEGQSNVAGETPFVAESADDEDGDGDDDQPRIEGEEESRVAGENGEGGEDRPRKRRRRGRRGGRRNRRENEGQTEGQTDGETAVYGELDGKPGLAAIDGEDADFDDEDTEGAQVDSASQPEQESAPALRIDVQNEAPAEDLPSLVEETVREQYIEEAAADLDEPAVASPSETRSAEVEMAEASEVQSTEVEEAKPARRGWWQRR